TDSAWHTYHVLLEEGVKELEEIQSRKLVEFSRQLLSDVREYAQNGVANKLVRYVSVGLGLQDQNFRESLPVEDKRIIEGLLNGAGSVESFIGFPLAPAQFRAQSFYTQSPELSAYFAARQWYGSVVFRLTDPEETKLAIALAMVVDGKPELLALWRELNEPFDQFLAPMEDGTLREYAAMAKVVSGANLKTLSKIEERFAEIRKKLEAELSGPRVNDQLLAPDQYAAFPKETRGLRLFPPRR